MLIKKKEVVYLKAKSRACGNRVRYNFSIEHIENRRKICQSMKII